MIKIKNIELTEEEFDKLDELIIDKIADCRALGPDRHLTKLWEHIYRQIWLAAEGEVERRK